MIKKNISACDSFKLNLNECELLNEEILVFPDPLPLRGSVSDENSKETFLKRHAQVCQAFCMKLKNNGGMALKEPKEWVDFLTSNDLDEGYGVSEISVSLKN